MSDIVFHLTALTPLDGRYGSTASQLSPYASEFALIQIRTEVEIKYLIHLSKIGIVRKLKLKEEKLLLAICKSFTIQDAKEVKEYEKISRHDVKAVEMFLRAKVSKTSLFDVLEMIHFGLTSEDVNNISYRLQLYRSTQSVLIPTIAEIVNNLLIMAEKYKKTVMLGRTHGQAAIPTTLGKELIIFADRLSKQLEKLDKQKLTGKLNGAIGNYSAMYVAYPKINWIKENKVFISSLELVPNIVSNQINPYDDVSEYLQIYSRINNILLDLNQDLWRYISDGWFVQEVKKGEVGSSTMPQKVNPIDFENSEGNLGMANSILEFMSRKLLVSRLQRDLSDSTVIRNLATALGYSFIAYKSTLRGLSRIRINNDQIKEDLEKDWVILTEAVQTLLRKEKIKDSYEVVKQLSRGKTIGPDEWNQWVGKLNVDIKTKNVLQSLSPKTYVGKAVEIIEMTIKEIKKRI